MEQVEGRDVGLIISGVFQRITGVVVWRKGTTAGIEFDADICAKLLEAE